MLTFREFVLKESKNITQDVARRLYDDMKLDVDFEQFHMGMNVELEHTDVTKGNLTQTAKIAVAHLKEKPDYYTRLKKVEQE
jgi:hypothetical protein